MSFVFNFLLAGLPHENASPKSKMPNTSIPMVLEFFGSSCWNGTTNVGFCHLYERLLDVVVVRTKACRSNLNGAGLGWGEAGLGWQFIPMTESGVSPQIECQSVLLFLPVDGRTIGGL